MSAVRLCDVACSRLSHGARSLLTETQVAQYLLVRDSFQGRTQLWHWVQDSL
jgi:hypothetical protein